MGNSSKKSCHLEILDISAKEIHIFQKYVKFIPNLLSFELKNTFLSILHRPLGLSIRWKDALVFIKEVFVYSKPSKSVFCWPLQNSSLLTSHKRQLIPPLWCGCKVNLTLFIRFTVTLSDLLNTPGVAASDCRQMFWRDFEVRAKKKSHKVHQTL